MRTFFWKGYWQDEPGLAIPILEQHLRPLGYIVDFKRFSDLALTIVIEISEHRIDTLYKALCKCMVMEDFTPLASNRQIERTLYLHISFSKGAGKLAIETPAVPG